MAARFGATLNAVNRGLENEKPAKGADLVEDWETAVADLDMPGSKGIARDLGALRKQLESDKPNEERVRALLHRLGEATVKISQKAEKQGDKVRELGEALSEAGDAQADEDEDTDAKANPKRRSTPKQDGKADKKADDGKADNKGGDNKDAAKNDDKK